MRIEVLLFAQLKDEVGPSIVVEVAGPNDVDGVTDVTDVTDVAALRRALEAAHPAIARLGRRAAVAVNETYARDGEPVRAGDTVALLPPIAGG